MPSGYFAPATGLLWKIVEHYGRDPQALFEGCGIDRASIGDPDLRLPCERVEQLWERAARLVDDPDFGLQAARLLHPSHLGALGYAWLASPTLRAALERLCRYLKMLTEAREIRVSDAGGRVAIETRLEPAARGLPERADIAMTVLMTMCRWNCGPDLRPLAVRFRHPRPSDASGFDALFGVAVVFGADRNEIVLATGDVDRPLPSGNPHLARINDAYLVDYLERLERGDLTSLVKRAIAERLSGGAVRIVTVAEALNLSVRTLQRRLESSGTSFGDLIDETRREMAERGLRDSGTTLTEIAFRTGFSSQSAFTGAVRRWTGMAPGAYRRRLLAAG